MRNRHTKITRMLAAREGRGVERMVSPDASQALVAQRDHWHVVSQVDGYFGHFGDHPAATLKPDRSPNLQCSRGNASGLKGRTSALHLSPAG